MVLRKVYRAYRKFTRRALWVLALAMVLIVAGILNHPAARNAAVYRLVGLIVLVALIIVLPYWIPKLVRRRKKNKRVANPSWWQQRKLRAAGFDEIDKMSGVEFENRMYVYFRNVGWNAEKTPVSGDFGADLVLTNPSGKRIVAQLKRYSGQVGVDAVQEVAAAIPFYNAVGGMLITNSHLTRNAQRLAKAHQIEVWEREQLAEKLTVE